MFYLQINDSSLVISVLQSYLVKGGTQSLAEVLDMYPVMTNTDKKGKEVMERANIYFIMMGEKGGGDNLAELRYVLLGSLEVRTSLVKC